MQRPQEMVQGQASDDELNRFILFMMDPVMFTQLLYQAAT